MYKESLTRLARTKKLTTSVFCLRSALQLTAVLSDKSVKNSCAMECMLDAFIAKRCLVAEGERVTTIEFKTAFCEWLMTSGQNIWSANAIWTAMQEKSFERRNETVAGAVKRCFVGLRLKDESSC